jgi:hypothetical protein
MQDQKRLTTSVLLGLVALTVVILTTGCEKKKEIPSSSGGGNSTQSVMTIKGAGQ